MAEEQLKQEHLSQLIFTTLSVLGFDREFLLHKSEALQTMFLKQSNRLFETSIFPVKMEFVGSAAEGVMLSGSDTDCMFIITDTVCVDTAYVCKGFNVLEADYTSTAPGYVKLVLSHGDEDSAMFELLKQSELYKTQLGTMYISSPILRNFFLQVMQEAKICFNLSSDFEPSSQGPAITSLSNDIVLAIYYHGCSYLSKWSKRIRYCHWPSFRLINEISSIEGYLVPVGHKSSDSQNIEWRVCYTTAELNLIKSLTDVQLKFYVLLKCVAKEIKKSVCEDITSYIVKNVVFWIVETEPEQAFTPSHLVKLLKKAIKFIKYCLQNNHLPNYMIPERNLIRENMNGKEKRKIIKELKEYEDFAINKVPKLFECMCFVNQILERPQINIYREWRKQVENCLLARALCKAGKLKLEMCSKNTICIDMEWEFFKDIRFWPITIRLMDLIVPDWINLVLLGKLEYVFQLYVYRLNAMPSL